MHNDDTKRSVQLLMTIALLLSGVVCGAAAAGTKVTAQGLSLPKIGIPVDQSENKSGSDPKRMAAQTGPTSLMVTDLPDDIVGEGSGSAGYQLVIKAVREELRQGRPTYALKILENDPIAKKLKNAEFDRVRAKIAQSFIMEGKVKRAADVAGQAVDRSGKSVPLAAWVAGQAAWRMQNFDKALSYFAICAKSDKSSAWLASGAAYWAARSATRAGHDDVAKTWYMKAASHPRTFYGLISLRVLGHDMPFNWDGPSLSYSDKKALGLDLKVGAAIRLSREGELTAAISTLSASKWMQSENGRRALLAFFQAQKQPALSMYLAQKTRDEDGRLYDIALYPESPWEPQQGYRVDKALIHALIRQESRFNPYAVSRAGAQGLMQIMPSTAQYVSAKVTKPLSHPETNIEVGQKYVQVLLNDKAVNNDLFKMAIAYNAGPGNLARWTNDLKDVDDPMLFIESIPSGETRAFVERVMVNYWVYRLRMGQDVASLDAVANLDATGGVVKTAQRIGADMVAMASGN